VKASTLSLPAVDFLLFLKLTYSVFKYYKLKNIYIHLQIRNRDVEMKKRREGGEQKRKRVKARERE